MLVAVRHGGRGGSGSGIRLSEGEVRHFRRQSSTLTQILKYKIDDRRVIQKIDTYY